MSWVSFTNLKSSLAQFKYNIEQSIIPEKLKPMEEAVGDMKKKYDLFQVDGKTQLLFEQGLAVISSYSEEELKILVDGGKI